VREYSYFVGNFGLGFKTRSEYIKVSDVLFQGLDRMEFYVFMLMFVKEHIYKNGVVCFHVDVPEGTHL